MKEINQATLERIKNMKELTPEFQQFIDQVNAQSPMDRGKSLRDKPLRGKQLQGGKQNMEAETQNTATENTATENTATENLVEDSDWRNDVGDAKDTLKVLDKETAVFTFVDNGKSKISADYGNSIVFVVKVDGEEEEKNWYVNCNNYDLLGQIKELGALVDLKVKVERKGSKKSDTRYTIKKA